MKKFSTILLVMFMVVFMIIRSIIAVQAQFGKDFMGVVPMNELIEIILLFVTLVCIVLVAKRNMIGAAVYLGTYAIYYGADITGKLSVIIKGGILSLADNMSMFLSFCGIILPIAVLVDLLLDKNRKINPKDPKTDWFYKNEKFDRDLDDRSDKNNYRTM